MRGSLVIMNLIPHPKSFLQRRILSSFNEDKNHMLGIMVKNGRLEHKNASRVTDRAQNYMLLMTELEDLSITLVQWKSLPTWNPLAQTVILLIEPLKTVDEKDYKVKHIFDELLHSGMIFANVMYQMESDAYKMEVRKANLFRHIKLTLSIQVESWFPYYRNSCATSVDNIYKIDECIVKETVNDETGEISLDEKIFEFSKDKEPKVPHTFHGCQFNVSTFVWEPFVVGRQYNANLMIESGLEILMLKAIAKQMEMKLKYSVLSPEIATAKITSDNQTGIYADLIHK